MNRTHSLPEGWALPCVGDVAILLAGYGFPTEHQGRTEGDVPFFKVGDISEAWQRNERFLTTAKHYVSFDDVTKLRAKPLPTESVVFAKIGAAISLNRRAILSQPSLIDNNCMGLAANSGVLDTNYLFYFTCTLRLGESSRASIVPSLRKSDVESIPLPLPPLYEQHRIVAKIEELFSDLDAGVAALKRAKANLKRYRAAVLKAAVEGKLTEAWRAEHRDTEPASKLLERILAERLQKWEADQLAKFAAAKKEPPKNWKAKYVEPTPPDTTGLPELPEGWCWVSVDQLLVEPTCNGISIKGSDSPPGIPALRLNSMTQNGFNYDERRYIPISDELASELAVRLGDMFVSRGNGSLHLVGRSVLAQEPPETIVFPDTMIRLRLCGLGTLREFINLVWASRLMRRQIEKKARTTAGIYKISQRDVEEFVIPVPPLSEQQQIVAEVAELVSDIDASEVAVEHSLRRAARLRQSILKQAFEGRLVPQDPTDEPASVLLERLRAKQARHEGNGKADTSARTHGRRAKSKMTEGRTNE